MTIAFRHTLACIVVLVAALVQRADAQFVVTYNFNDPSTSTIKLTADVTGSQAILVTANPFTAPGTADVSSSTDTAFLRSTETGNNEAAALADADYFQFTLQAANPGEFLDLSSFTFSFGGTADTTFTSNVVVQSSVGGFGTGNPTLVVTPSSFSIPSATTSTVTLTSASIDVSGFAFNSLSSVTFQIRFFDNASGTNQINRVDNLQISGAVVPEPSALLLLLGVFSALVAFGRRHRHPSRHQWLRA